MSRADACVCVQWSIALPLQISYGGECAVSRLVRVSKNPAQSIVQCSQDGECDLVLMSTHGEAGIGRLAFGSVTDRVLRDGQTPLLLAHPPQS